MMLQSAAAAETARWRDWSATMASVNVQSFPQDFLSFVVGADMCLISDTGLKLSEWAEHHLRYDRPVIL